MNERDLEPEEPPPRAFVDQLDAVEGEPLELGGDVVHLEGDMVHPRPAIGQELADGRLGAQRGEKLDPVAADAKRGGLDTLVGQPVAMLDGRAEQALVSGNGAVEILDRDSDVVDPRHESMLSAAKRERITAMRRALSLLFLAVLLAGCGSSGTKDNGEAAKTAAQVVADAKAASMAAATVHISGVGTTSGQPLKLDLFLVAGKGGRGMLTVNGLTFQIVRVGNSAYFKGDSTFWRNFGGAAAAELLQGRWLEAPANAGRFSAFTPLTDIGKLFTALFALKDSIRNEGRTTLDGVSVVAIKDTTNAGTLYVAASGTPYPVAIRQNGQGKLKFDAWNGAVTLAAPKRPVKIASLTG
jgi:hypothetical protein